MRLSILVLSVALNVAAVAAIWLRLEAPPIAVRDTPTVAPAQAPELSLYRVPIGAHFEVDDLLTLRDRLREAGFPPHLVKAIIVARVQQKSRAQVDANMFPEGDRGYWSGIQPSTREELRTNMRIHAKASELLNELLGPGYDQSARRRAEEARWFGPIAPEKIESLERLEKDYRDLITSYRTGMFQLPSDTEAVAFLEAERKADLVALLTPSELFEYELRTSVTARQLTYSIRAFGASEEEFRELYAIWQPPASESAMGGFVSVSPNERETNNQNLLVASAGVLSPERVAELEQSLRLDATFENATAVRLDLPLSAARQLYEARVEVRGKNDAERAVLANGDEAAAAIVRLKPERGAQLWAELVETFGEEHLRDIRPVTGGKWLRTIMPVPSEPGG